MMRMMSGTESVFIITGYSGLYFFGSRENDDRRVTTPVASVLSVMGFISSMKLYDLPLALTMNGMLLGGASSVVYSFFCRMLLIR